MFNVPHRYNCVRRAVAMIAVVSIFAVSSAFAQTTTPLATQPALTRQPLVYGLPDGTPVKLRISRNLSSADAKTGETIDLEVLEEIKIGDTVIIPKGGTALGTVTRGKPKGRMGKGGKLDINIDSVRTISGEKVALRAVKETKGKGSTGVMTGAIVASSILFFPAAPFFLFMKGKDIKIPKGTEVTAYVSGDTEIDPNRVSPSETLLNSQVASSSAGFSTIAIKSDPEGAEIVIDGKFVGNTPSTIQLQAGDHVIFVNKSGFKTWERTMTSAAGGNVTLNAVLEKALRP